MASWWLVEWNLTVSGNGFNIQNQEYSVYTNVGVTPMGGLPVLGTSNSSKFLIKEMNIKGHYAYISSWLIKWSRNNIEFCLSISTKDESPSGDSPLALRILL